MHTQQSDSAERARGILEAWQRRDLDGLQAALSLAHAHCGLMPEDNFEEQERLDLLDGIAEQLQRDLSFLFQTPGPAEVCHRLLTHLALSGHHPAIRPKKLAVFPC